MKIIKYTKKNKEEVINEAVEVLKNGGIIVYPTETVYGMGVDPLNQEAVDKLFSYKERREGKPLSIAVSGQEMASIYADVNETAQNLYKNFLPGPITVVSKGLHKLAKGVESELGTIGIRMPNDDLILEIVRTYGRPVTATSANASYKKRPYKIDDILETISQRQKDLIDLIIDVGELPHNEPSTVVDTTLNELSVLRQGDVVLTDFETYESSSVADTKKLATMLLDRYKEHIGERPIIFALQGDMGAGKTHFTKGIGEYFRIKDPINSPTYILESDYDFAYNGKKHMLVHIDTWRMLSAEEFEELHIPKHLAKNAVIVIEWAEKAYKQIGSYKDKGYIVWIKFKVTGDETRNIIFSDTFIS